MLFDYEVLSEDKWNEKEIKERNEVKDSYEYKELESLGFEIEPYVSESYSGYRSLFFNVRFEERLVSVLSPRTLSAFYEGIESAYLVKRA